MSIFVSWRGADRDIKNQIVDQLRSLLPQEEIWESDEGCKSNSFVFMEQVRKSEIFIVIVSDAAMQPSYVLNEVVEARRCEMEGTLNMLVYKITDSPYTPEFAANLNHLTDSNYLARLQGTDDGVALLANRVRDLLEKRRRGEPESPYEAFVPELVGASLSAGYFVPHSRDNVFEAMDRAFEHSNILFATQLSGYGRKSAAREYALQHRAEYRQVVVLHYFSGSLREFFLNGIQFANVNRDLFASMDEQEILLKKARLLEKLGTDVLLIVPDVTPDERDDRFVCDCLAKLGCRVIFVTQSDPRRLRNAFPVISIDRMEDQYLNQLFFNYYNASPEEQQFLSPVLHQFYDNIDGHTRSVEIAANVLAEEFGIYPEDLPGILENICGEHQTELSDRIFQLISGLFDVTSFTKTQQAILQVAVHFARPPIDEKQFAELLKQSGCYDGEGLRALIDRRWLDNDRETRTVSVDSFMARVLQSKIPADQKMLGRCMQLLYDKLVSGAMTDRIGAFYLDLKRARCFAQSLQLPSLDRLLDTCCRCEDSLPVDLDMDDLEALKQASLDEINSLSNSTLKKAMVQLVDLVCQLVCSFLLLNDPAFREDSQDLNVKYISSVLTEETIQLAIQGIRHSRLRKTVADFLQTASSGDFSKTISQFIFCVDLLCEPEVVSRVDFEVSYVFSTLGRNLATITNNSPYLCLRLCRAWKKLNDTYGYTSHSNAFRALYFYYLQLYKNKLFDQEFDDLFETLMDTYDQSRSELFTTPEEMSLAELGLYEVYLESLVIRKQWQEARQISNRLLSIRIDEPEGMVRQLKAVDELVNSLIKEGRTQEALDCLEEMLPQLPADFTSEEESMQEVELCYAGLKDIYTALKEPITVQPFVDRAEDYIDYYHTYAPSAVDKKRLARYGEIARQAKGISYADYTQQDLLDTVRGLKARAMAGASFSSVAPEAFALVSEAGQRTLGYRHHYVQYMGGAAIADGNVAEIQNGEGKTYTIILAAFLHHLYGKQVHIVDQSGYLTFRNYHWMAPTLELLGCKVGMIEKLQDARKKNYSDFDILYTTARELIFLYASKEFYPTERTLRTDVAIIDEAEQLLIADGNRCYSLTSQTLDNKKEWLLRVEKTIAPLTLANRDLDFTYNDATGALRLRPKLYQRLEQQETLSMAQVEPKVVEFLERAMTAGLRANLFMVKDKDYFVNDGKIFYEDTVHGIFEEMEPIKGYFLSRKEGLTFDFSRLDERRVDNEYIALEFLKNYEMLTGTTATAVSMERELHTYYDLDVIPIPPNEPTRRVNHPTAVFMDGVKKRRHIVELIGQKHSAGQPVLVITDSVYASVQLSRALDEASVPHHLLNATNIDQGADLLEEAGHPGVVTVTTALANRGVDIRLGGNPVTMTQKHLLKNGLTREEIARLAAENGPEPNTYCQLLSFYRQKTEQARKELNELGGLCVIGTACFDDLRVEQQLRGRCGRQGDRGETYVFIAMDDDSMKELLGNRMDTTRNMLGVQTTEMAFHSEFLNKAIERARKLRQRAYTDRLGNLPEMYYRPKARAALVALQQQLHSGLLSPREVIERYMAQSARNAEDLLAFSRGKQVENAVVQSLYSYIAKSVAGASRRAIPGLLMEGWQAFCADHAEAVPAEWQYKELIIAWVGRQWPDFLKEMHQEVNAAVKIYNGIDKKIERHLCAFAEKRVNELLEYAAGISATALCQPAKTP